MRKFVATAAVAASAAATLALTPLAAHAAVPADSEIRTGCSYGIQGYYSNPSGFTTPFALSPGTMFDIPAASVTPGQWSFTINKPGSLESYGPALDNDRDFGFETQRVERATVNTDEGRTSTYWNDTANSFSFNVAPGSGTAVPGVPFHVYYQCGVGRS